MVAAALAVAMLACGRGGGASGDGGTADAAQPGSPQALYTYEGCDDRDQGCPRLPTLYCAFERITARHQDCAADSDCVFASVETGCSGFPSCPGPAVNASQVRAFEEAFEAEVRRYCADGGATCVASTSGCSVSRDSYRASCLDGRCRSGLIDGGQ